MEDNNVTFLAPVELALSGIEIDLMSNYVCKLILELAFFRQTHYLLVSIAQGCTWNFILACATSNLTLDHPSGDKCCSTFERTLRGL